MLTWESVEIQSPMSLLLYQLTTIFAISIYVGDKTTSE